MHRLLRDRLEEVLADSGIDATAKLHLDQCEECRGEIASMREHAEMLRGLRAEAEPRPGFYARLIERIEFQRPVSIWKLFSDSPFGRRIAIASMALALLVGVYLVTSDTVADQPIQILAGEDQPGLASAPPHDADGVLVNLVTYREQ
jgi:predicted anti-sigma-YlaC factor YlaD